MSVIAFILSAFYIDSLPIFSISHNVIETFDNQIEIRIVNFYKNDIYLENYESKLVNGDFVYSDDLNVKKFKVPARSTKKLVIDLPNTNKFSAYSLNFTPNVETPTISRMLLIHKYPLVIRYSYDIITDYNRIMLINDGNVSLEISDIDCSCIGNSLQSPVYLYPNNILEYRFNRNTKSLTFSINGLKIDKYDFSYNDSYIIKRLVNDSRINSPNPNKSTGNNRK